jgi:hypothetical protein
VAQVKWLYENGVLTFAQAILVFAGLLFTGYQLRLARRSFQATIISQVTERSSQLQWDVMQDSDLQPLLGFPDTERAEYKRKLAAARVVNNFASIFDLWQLGGMPNDTWRTFEADVGLSLPCPNSLIGGLS